MKYVYKEGDHFKFACYQAWHRYICKYINYVDIDICRRQISKKIPGKNFSIYYWNNLIFYTPLNQQMTAKLDNANIYKSPASIIA